MRIDDRDQQLATRIDDMEQQLAIIVADVDGSGTTDAVVGSRRRCRWSPPTARAQGPQAAPAPPPPPAHVPPAAAPLAAPPPGPCALHAPQGPMQWPAEDATEYNMVELSGFAPFW